MDYDYWLRNSLKIDMMFFDEVITNFMVRAEAQSSSKKKMKENTGNLRAVRKRYLNPVELCAAELLRFLLSFFQKALVD